MKRRIGGHFGQAVGAKSAKGEEGEKKKPAWREEVSDAEGGAAGAESDSDEVMDPGTPLPSEEEPEKDEKQEEEKPEEEAAGAALGSDAAPETIKVDEISGERKDDEEKKDMEEKKGGGDEATVSASTNGVDASTAETNGVHLERRPIVTLELMRGDRSLGELKVEFFELLSAITEWRLSGLLEEGGTLVARMAQKESMHLAPPPCKVSENQEIQLLTGGLPPAVHEEVRRGGSESGMRKIPHDVEGLLSAPRRVRRGDQGFALTLGPAPSLDSTHGVLGRVVRGRAAIRKAQVLAPVIPGAPALELHMKCASLAQDDAEPASEAGYKPFAREDEHDVAGGVDVLELAALELDGREEEVRVLKTQQFGRARVQGVAAVEDCLTVLKENLEKIASAAKDTDGDEAIEQEAMWQLERVRLLNRLAEKLR